MPKFRYITLPTGARAGHWRNTRAEALQDAILADLAEADEEAPEGVQIDAMVHIQEGEPLTDWELWACANEALEQHGLAVHRHIAKRIEALTNKADAAGVLTWKAIASRVKQLVAKQDQNPIGKQLN